MKLQFKRGESKQGNGVIVTIEGKKWAQEQFLIELGKRSAYYAKPHPPNSFLEGRVGLLSNRVLPPPPDDLIEDFMFPFRRGEVVLDMQVVAGRHCHTTVRMIGEGKFFIPTDIAEACRGSMEFLFEQTRDTLEGDLEGYPKLPIGALYRGQSLLVRDEVRPFSKRSGESDWEFIRRIFPEMFATCKNSPARVLEILLGESWVDWDNEDMMNCLVVGLATGIMSRAPSSIPSDEMLKALGKAILDQITIDPVSRKRAQKAAPNN